MPTDPVPDALDVAIDESLRRLFAPPSDDTVRGWVDRARTDAPPRSDSHPDSRPGWLALAAALTVYVTAGLWLIGVSGRPPMDGVALYEAVVSPVVTDMSCVAHDPLASLNVCGVHFGHGLELADDAHATVLQQRHLEELDAGAIVVQCQGATILLVVTPRERELDLGADLGSSVRVFSEIVGPYLVHEITPLREPVLLDGLEAE